MPVWGWANVAKGVPAGATAASAPPDGEQCHSAKKVVVQKGFCPDGESWKGNLSSFPETVVKATLLWVSKTSQPDSWLAGLGGQSPIASAG